MANGKFTSLIDIWDSRPDLQEAFPDKGKALNDWFNKNGATEYPGVTLVSPGDSKIQDPITLTAEAQKQGIIPTLINIEEDLRVDASRLIERGFKEGDIVTIGDKNFVITPENKLEETTESADITIPDELPETTPQLTTPPRVSPDAPVGNLIRFTTSNTVFDTSTGELVELSAQDFADKGFSFDDVEEVDPLQVGARLDDQTKDVFVNIGGQEILVTDIDAFNKTGLPKTIFTQQIAEKSPAQMFEEVRTRKLLGEVWDKRPDLQQVYERPGFLSPGESTDPRTAGSSMETWATQTGWSEESKELQSYRPQNFVRAAFWNLFQQDPFDPATSDPRALELVQSIEAGDITSFDSLRGRLKLDKRFDFDELTDEEKLQIEIDVNIPPEEVGPRFSEFFDKILAREKIVEQTKLFFEDELNQFLIDKGISERRTIEDFARLVISEDLTKEEIEQLRDEKITIQELKAKLEKEGRQVGGELSAEEERDLTTVDRQFRNALLQATEGFGRAGLAFSSLRIEEEKRQKDLRDIQKKGISLDIEKQRQEQERIKQRALETNKRAEEKLRAEQEIEIPAKIEETFSLKRQRAIEEFEALQKGVLEESDLGTFT